TMLYDGDRHDQRMKDDAEISPWVNINTKGGKIVDAPSRISNRCSDEEILDLIFSARRGCVVRPNQFIVAKQNEGDPPGDIDGVQCTAKHIVDGMEDPSDAREKQRGRDSQKKNECYEIVKQNGSDPSKVKEGANEMVENRSDPYDSESKCQTPGQ